MVNGINRLDSQLVQSTTDKIKNPNADKHLMKLSKQGSKGLKGDKVSLKNEVPETKEYTKATKAAKLEVTADYKALRSLVSSFLHQQGITGEFTTGETTTNIMDLTPEMARDFIGEDGYWGVEQTSDRIVDFAISAAGNDPNNLDKIKEGINSGLEMAKEAFGGTLPEISKQTYNATMEKLDAWASHPTEPPQDAQDTEDKSDTAAPEPASA